MRRRGPGIVGTMARTAVVAGTASAVAGRVHHRQEQKWDQQAEQQYAQQQYEQQQYAQQQQQYAPPPPAPEPAAEQPAYVAEIEQLAALRNQGILTPEEFEAKKRQILGL